MIKKNVDLLNKIIIQLQIRPQIALFSKSSILNV